MKIRLIVAVTLILALAGCATTSGTRGVSGSPLTGNVDDIKIVTVNEWAQARGAKIIWLNLPQRSRFADEAPSLN